MLFSRGVSVLRDSHYQLAAFKLEMGIAQTIVFKLCCYYDSGRARRSRNKWLFMWRRTTIYLKPIHVSRKSSSSTQPWLLLSYYQCSDVASIKNKATPLQERRMIDRFRLHVKGGDGGNGCNSARRSRHDRNGKPDGGNGGRGGDVILQCTSTVWDYRGLQHHVNGRKGGPGASKNQIGSRGEDKIVQVPVGTVIHLVEGEIPSVVDEKPSSFSDPWEIPGDLDSDSSELNNRLTPCTSTLKVEKKCALVEPSFTDKKQFKKPSSIKQTFQQSSVQSSLQPPLSFYQHKTRGEMVMVDDTESDYESTITDYEDDEMDYDMHDEEEEIQFNVAELTEEGQRILVACGGQGGTGSVSSGRVFRKSDHLKIDSNQNSALDGSCDEEYSKSSVCGLPGSEAVLILELKTIADVGLVGLPNAGKSTLLGSISRAKPAVGNYAFTTLRPNIGKLNYDDFSVSVADIPGLIKGAHENRGLGHNFLRHIERTKVLAYVVDLAASLHGRKGVPPWEQLRDLMLELEYYREGLSSRPSLVVANKIDELGAEDVYKELERRVHDVPIFPVCAVLGEGVEELKDGLRELINGEQSSVLDLQSITVD